MGGFITSDQIGIHYCHFAGREPGPLLSGGRPRSQVGAELEAAGHTRRAKEAI